MKEIVDVNGNPIQSKVLDEQQTAKLGWITRDFAQHPGRRLTPQKLHRILEQAELGDLDRVERILRVYGMVNVAPGFDRMPAVIDGCSDLLVDVFGDAGRHSRSAVGLASLPFGIAVEIELTARLHQ